MRRSVRFAKRLIDVMGASVGLALAQSPDPARWGAAVIRNGLGIMSFFPTFDGDVVPEAWRSRLRGD